MELVAQIIRGIAVVVLLSLCLEMLLPKSELQPYIRTVTGLLLIVAVLFPLAENKAAFSATPLFSMHEWDTTQVLNAGSELAQSWEQEAKAEIVLDLNKKIQSLLLLNSSVTDVIAESDYVDNEIVVKLKVYYSGDDLVLMEKLRSAVADYFTVQEKNIQIELLRSETHE